MIFFCDKCKKRIDSTTEQYVLTSVFNHVLQQVVYRVVCSACSTGDDSKVKQDAYDRAMGVL